MPEAADELAEEAGIAGISAPGAEERLLKDIAALVLGEPEFRELERALDVFCPFESMGVVRHEIRHSNFLSYILDPGRPHGFGSRMLERLVGTVLEHVGRPDGSDLTVLDIYLRDFSRTEVRREWRNIDVLTLTPMGERGLVVAVELKIEAEEHGDQLRRMRHDVETTWPDWTRLLVFLSPDGRPPSDAHGAGWRALDLGVLLDAFEAELDQDEAGYPDARGMLRAYVAMLRRRYVSNSKHEQIAAELWRRHPQALGFLADQRPDIRTKVMDILADAPDSIGRLSEAAAARVIIDSRTTNTIRLAVRDWDAIEGFCRSTWTQSQRFVLFEVSGNVEVNGGVRFSMILQLGKGEPAARAKLLNILRPNQPPVAGQWTRLVRARRLHVATQDAPRDIATKLEAELIEFLQSAPVREVFAALRAVVPPAEP